MIFFPFEEFLNFLQICVHVIQRIRLKRIQREDLLGNVEIILIVVKVLDLFSMWLDLVTLFLKYLKCKGKRKRLYKPYMLIQLLAGYRYLF